MKLTALYERLSKDDDTLGESVSIRNQKAMLEDYARQHGYEPFRHFTDDGWTGTNFHRPGFRAMMDLVEKGEVERIIVKDLSRFGRDYLRTGFYVDVLFPELDIHFIAIHSHADSRSGIYPDYIPFLNIMNDIVNRERSRKAKARHAENWAQGRHTPHLPLYGYRYHPMDPERYVPDPDAAPVVQEIFRLRLTGMTCTEIAEELTRRKIPTRAWHMYCELRGEQYPHVCQPGREWNEWTLHAVRNVLLTEEYTGVFLVKKYTSPEIQRSITSPDPIRLEGHHEALVSREVWEQVQAMKKNYARRDALWAADQPLGADDTIHCPVCSDLLSLCMEDGRPTYRCRNCRKRDPGDRLKLFKEELQTILHQILMRCWDPNGYRFPERISPIPPDRRGLQQAFERHPGAESFLHDRRTMQYISEHEHMEQERSRIAAQRKLLRSPRLDLYSLAVFSEDCFWQRIVPEKQQILEHGRRFQTITVFTWFRPEGTLEYSDSEQCHLLYYSRKFSDYRVRILPVSPEAPTLTDRLRTCLQQGLLPNEHLQKKKKSDL